MALFKGLNFHGTKPNSCNINTICELAKFKGWRYKYIFTVFLRFNTMNLNVLNMIDHIAFGVCKNHS